jgi:hypothetical protein
MFGFDISSFMRIFHVLLDRNPKELNLLKLWYRRQQRKMGEPKTVPSFRAVLLRQKGVESVLEEAQVIKASVNEIF